MATNVRVSAAHKKRFEVWLSERLSEGRVAGADVLARQIMLLMDGAFSTMLVYRDPAYAEEAGRAARALVERHFP